MLFVSSHTILSVYKFLAFVGPLELLLVLVVAFVVPTVGFSNNDLKNLLGSFSPPPPPPFVVTVDLVNADRVTLAVGGFVELPLSLLWGKFSVVLVPSVFVGIFGGTAVLPLLEGGITAAVLLLIRMDERELIGGCVPELIDG